MAENSRSHRSSWLAATESHSRLHSTNDRALELARRDSCPTPLLVHTDRQTHGRGRGRNVWWSETGAVTFSLVCDWSTIPLPEARRSRIALHVGLAVREGLRQLVPELDVQLKWPNDVLVDGRKLGGILVENAMERGRVVIGIGLNVGNSTSDAPAGVSVSGIAICDVVAVCPDREVVLDAILESLRSELGSADREVAGRWSRACALTNRFVAIRSGHELVEGLGRGIDDDGAFLVSTAEGTRRIVSGTVETWE